MKIPEKRYRDLNSYFRARFGERVHKITVDAGFTCPNRDGRLSTGGCIYCNAKGSGTGQHGLGRTVTEQLEAARSRIAKRFKATKYIAYFQSFTNTYAPVVTLKRLYDEALAVEGVVGLAIGTRPDCVSPETLELLAGYTGNHHVWVEYGLQSANDTTLARINRGHDAACFADAVAATRGRGILICAHIILGLPGETAKDMRRTARFVADLGVDGVKIHLLYVVRETPMAELYTSGRYTCLTPAEYADRVCDTLEVLPPAAVIQRLTGDPHPDELLAPAWALEKAETMALIHRRLEERNTWQGKCFEGEGGRQHGLTRTDTD
ncbi:MAG: TIGR01212 family radical SAM protein [Pseudomonadota bacterium]